ncbi:MAG: hypothetical protein ACPGVE_08690 [Flavobacteriales bacterium]
MNEIKCNACKNWTDGAKNNCSFCGNLVNPKEIKKIEQLTKAEQLKKQKEEKMSAFEKWIEQQEKSKKWHVKILVRLVKIVWVMYMALLSFIIWFIAWLAG